MLRANLCSLCTSWKPGVILCTFCKKLPCGILSLVSVRAGLDTGCFLTHARWCSPFLGEKQPYGVTADPSLKELPDWPHSGVSFHAAAPITPRIFALMSPEGDEARAMPSPGRLSISLLTRPAHAPGNPETV